MAAGGARMELLRQGVPCGPTAERSGAFPASHTLHCLRSCHRQSQRHSLGSSAGGRPARQLQAARSCPPERTALLELGVASDEASPPQHRLHP